MIETILGFGVFSITIAIAFLYYLRIRRNERLRIRLGLVSDKTLPERSVLKLRSVPLIEHDIENRWPWSISQTLNRAGLPLKTNVFAILFLLCAIVAGGISFRVFGNIWLGLSFAILVTILQWVALSWYASWRIARIEAQLPDVLDSIVAALQAGIGFRPALDHLREHKGEPIGSVMREICGAMDLGVGVSEAFIRQKSILCSNYFDLLTTAIHANYDTGGNMSSVLAGLSRRIRDNIKLRRRVRSITAEARFSALVLFLFPLVMGTFIYYRERENMVLLYEDEMGKILLTIALALYAVGILWTVRLLKVKE